MTCADAPHEADDLAGVDPKAHRTHGARRETLHLEHHLAAGLGRLDEEIRHRPAENLRNQRFRGDLADRLGR